jgi:hypothetical protein
MSIHPHHPMKPFAIPADWTPQQALAVIDLLDELRCHIWARYELALQREYRELCRGEPGDPDQAEPFADDPVDF